MKIDINKAYSEAEWFDHTDGVRFKIRPYPASKESFGLNQNGEMVFSGRHQLEKFQYCLLDWEGVLDADDKPIPCNEAVKAVVFEAKLEGIPSIVFTFLRELEVKRGEVSKN